MKSSTKTLLTLGALGGAAYLGFAWAGGNAALKASRVIPPGAVSRRVLTDASGREVAVQYLYPSIGGRTPTYTVPIDPMQRGYAGIAAG